MINSSLDDWFEQQVLPLEPILVRFLRRNWRNEGEIADLRQEVYLRMYTSAANSRPALVQPFMFKVARNLLIDRVRRGQVVDIETIADLTELDDWIDELSPERIATGRNELRLLQTALDALPERCRQVVSLRKIYGWSQREIALEMGITEDTVERHISNGMRSMANALQAKGIQTGMEKQRHSLKKGGELQ